MWQTFWPDVLVAVIGAALTVLGALATYLAGRRLREIHAIRALVAELHHRRLLAIEPREFPGAAESESFRYASASVLSMKDEVRRARDAARTNSPAQAPLAAMTRACNAFLELSSAEPERYPFFARDLRDALASQVRILSTRHGIDFQQPGGGAFDADADA